MAKQSKYESEYTRLRNNIMQKQRRMLNKGYIIKPEKEKISLPTFKQLKSAPSAKDIKKLENILHKKIYDIYSYEIRDIETGNQKTVSAKEAIKYMRSQAAKKGAETKRRKKEFDKWVQEQYDYGGDFYEPEYNGNLPSPSSDESQEAKEWLEKHESDILSQDITDEDWFDDYWDSMQIEKEKEYNNEDEDFPEDYELPFTDEYVETEKPNEKVQYEEDLILSFVLNEIQRLYTFTSHDKNRSRGQEWENHLLEVGEELTNSFLWLMEKDRKKLALRCYNHSDEIVALITKLEYCYKTRVPENGIISDLFDIFKGTTTIDEAKSFETPFDDADDY